MSLVCILQTGFCATFTIYKTVVLLFVMCLDETVVSRQNVVRDISLVDCVTMSSAHIRLTGESSRVVSD